MPLVKAEGLIILPGLLSEVLHLVDVVRILKLACDLHIICFDKGLNILCRENGRLREELGLWLFGFSCFGGVHFVHIHLFHSIELLPHLGIFWPGGNCVERDSLAVVAVIQPSMMSILAGFKDYNRQAKFLLRALVVVHLQRTITIALQPVILHGEHEGLAVVGFQQLGVYVEHALYVNALIVICKLPE